MSRGSEIVEDRNAIYGDPVPNIERIQKMWEAITHTEITPIQVCLMMVCLKLVRESENHLTDNLDDIEGYVAIARMFTEEK